METAMLLMSEKILRPAFVLLLSGFLLIALLRLSVMVVLEPRKPPVRPSLYCKPSSLSKMLEDNVPVVSAAYSLPVCLTGLPRILSILAVLFLTRLCPAKWAGHLRFLREYLLLKDNGLVSLDWAVASTVHQHHVRQNKQHVRWIVLLMPGRLVCHSKSSLQSICQSLVTQGHCPVIVSSIWPPTCDDLRQVVQYLRFLHPHAPLALVGFSHSASLLISYLGEFGSSSLVQAAMAVSPVWRTQQQDWWSSPSQLDPLHDSDDIAVPLLVLHYEDDPFVSDASLPRDLFGIYPHLLLLSFPLGSHCGQFLRQPTADRLVLPFLQEILPFTNWTPRSAAPLDQQHLSSKSGKVSSNHHHHESANHRHRRRVESLSSRKPRRHHQHSVRPSCGSC